MLRLRTDKTLSALNKSEDDIFAIFKNLNYNKSHGWDDLSINMIKICGKSTAYPLKLIFEASLLGVKFPECWKRAKRSARLYKRKQESGEKLQTNKSSSNFWKIFERVIFKNLFNYVHKNELFTKCQSGFLHGDSCASQLLSIVHDINSSFDPTQDFRGAFLDMSKAFV